VSARLLKHLAAVAFALACSPSWAQTMGDPAAVLIEASADAALAARRVSSSDTAALLAGVDSAQAGGVSSLPMLHGLGDDRIRSLVNGVPIAAACPMHMNPPLSYIDPANASRIEVMPGVTPVSLGGDSIGGTILVESAPPRFAATNDAVERGGSVSSFYRSNTAAIGGAAAASMATSNVSFAYEVLVFGRRTIATVAGRRSTHPGWKPRTNRSRLPGAAGKIYTKPRWRCSTCPMKGFPTRTWI
jgi:iron complex outermembrane receptor protein